MSEYDPEVPMSWAKDCQKLLHPSQRLALLGLLQDNEAHALLIRLFEMSPWERGNALAEIAKQVEPKLSDGAKIEWSLARRQEAAAETAKHEDALQVWSKPVTKLELSVRALNVLANYNIRYVGELAPHSEEHLKQLRHVGARVVREYREALADLKIKLGDKPPADWQCPEGDIDWRAR